MTTALRATATAAARVVDAVRTYGAGDTEVRALDGGASTSRPAASP